MSSSAAENLISTAAADKLISAHDGDVALLYICYQRLGRADAEYAARELCRTMVEVTAAEEKLRRMGLMPESQKSEVPAPVLPPPAPIREERPQYSSQEISLCSQRDEAFKDILDECAKLMGHQLGKSEMNTLLGIYRNLALPYEVMLMLLNYCADLNQEKYRGQRRLSAYFIEQEAYRWAQNEIITVEQAEDFIRRAERRRTDCAKLAAAIGIHDRPLAKSEREYINKWLDMGFDEPEVLLAYDRTVLQTGKLSFRYLDAILERWKKAGLMDIKAIEEKDPPKRGARKGASAARAQSQNIDMDALQKVLDNI